MTRVVLTTLAALLLPATLIPVKGAGVEIQMTGDAFRLAGWKASAEPATGWQSVLAVYVSADAPLLGRYEVEDGALVFRPRWPIAPGMHVRAVFRGPDAAPVNAEFDVPKAAAAPATRIEHIYPSTDTLPANALRLYVYFSAPMRRGEAWQHLALLDERGERVELPFLELDQELWDASNIRLTILFDPGRIKRGLFSRAEAGPSIVEGKRYTLRILADWRDANGTPLAAVAEKSFRVVAEEREPVSPENWRIGAPVAGTREPLVLTFPRPLDYALLQHTIAVAGVTGKVAVGGDETEWRFTPEEPWKPGEYRLSIETSLEDLAGNRVGRVFDVDTFREVTKQITKETTSLAFRVAR